MQAVAVTGRDPRTDKRYVDILFIGIKGGSGATFGADGYDHIGLINCAGGLLAQDYEMFEIYDPHLLIKHEYDTDSAGCRRMAGRLGYANGVRLSGRRN